MAWLTRDDLIAGFSRRQRLAIQKPSVTSEGAGTYQSLWKAAGNPVAGATAATGNGAIPTSATAGAIPFVNPGGGRAVKLTSMEIQGATIGQLLLFDVLWWNSGLDCSSVALQSFTQPALPSGRCDATGVGVEPWGYFWAAPGATGANFNILYTDNDGNAGQAGQYVHPANAETIDQIVPFNLAAGDRGVRSIASLQLSLSTGAAGNFGLMLLRRIASIPVTLINSPLAKDWAQIGLPDIFADSCLMMAVLCSTTNTGQLNLDLTLGEN